MSTVLHFIVRVLEVMFFVGLAGSLVVAIAAFVGDIPNFLRTINSCESGRLLRDTNSSPLYPQLYLEKR
jgi:hypothetical protein